MRGAFLHCQRIVEGLPPLSVVVPLEHLALARLRTLGMLRHTIKYFIPFGLRTNEDV